MHRLRCREFAAPRSSFPTRPIPVRNGQLPTDHSEPILSRLGGYRRLVFGVVAALAVPGCGHDAEIEFTKVAHAPTVQLLNPPVRDIIRVVGQPSFIEAYERTSIYAKPTAYIQKWIVDIGDTVKKGDVLATLFVPELVEDHQTKMATVALDQRRIDLAREAVEVA
jgi:multidrug efflux pump subunit AcrA (membrane-fusion protein)